MNRIALLLIVVFAGFAGFLIGAAHWNWLTKVNAQAQPRASEYIVIGASGDTKLNQELSQFTRRGCRPILAAGAGYTEVMVIVECPAQ